MCQLMHSTKYTQNSFSLAVNYTKYYCKPIHQKTGTCLVMWCPIIVTHKLCIDRSWVYWAMHCIGTVFWTLQSQVLAQDTGITRRILRFFVGHHPPSVYLSLCHIPYTWLNFPLLALRVWHTASDWKLEAGTTWEWGYHHVVCTVHILNFDWSSVWVHYCMLWGWCEDVVMAIVANYPQISIA